MCRKKQLYGSFMQETSALWETNFMLNAHVFMEFKKDIFVNSITKSIEY